MATVLYITSSPGDKLTSFSKAVGKEFVDTYRDANPQDEVVHLDLSQMDITTIDADVLSAWGKLRSGSGFEQLSAAEQKKVVRINEVADQFAAADKYVFASPLWNLSIPPRLKVYIDSVCIAGKAFRYVDGYPVGLLTDKKAVHIQASGGVFSEGSLTAMESGHSYLAKIMKFIGVPSFQAIFVEGTAAAPDQAESIKEAAIVKARELAVGF